MNWPLILLLAGFGPFVALLWQQGLLPTAWAAVTLLIVVPVACASWISTGTKDQPFKHGFLAGWVIWASMLAISISGNPTVQANLAKSPMPRGLLYLLLIVVHGSLFGGWVGLLSMVAAAGARNDWYWFRNAVRWRLATLLFGIGPMAALIGVGVNTPADRQQAMLDVTMPIYAVFHVAGLVLGGLAASRLGRRTWPWVVGGIFSSGLALVVLALIPPGDRPPVKR